MAISNETVEIPCPSCKTAIVVRLGDVAPGKTTSCPGCNVTIEFAGEDVSASTAKLDEALESLERMGR